MDNTLTESHALLWKLLTNMANNYPDEPTLDTKYHCVKFIESLPYMLPCQFGYQFQQFIHKYFINHCKWETVKNRDNLTIFIKHLRLAFQ